jgi:hypothetical protein
LKRFEQIVPSRNSAENPMLAAARGAAAARVTEAELEMAKALATLQSTPIDVAVKVNTIDLPLVGPYHTYYSQIFGSRPVTRAHVIDQTLPIRLKAINDWVATVHSGTTAVQYAEQAHAKGEVDLRTVLACHEELRMERRRFLDAVYRYNVDIAEYAALAAPAGTSPEKFASMLIPAKQPERLSALPSRPGLPFDVRGQRQPQDRGWVPTLRNTAEQAPQAEAANPADHRYGNQATEAGQGSSRNEEAPPSRYADPFSRPSAGSRYGN